MMTSYFGNKKLKDYPKEQLVSLSARPPIDGIRIYKPLCPSWNLVSNYKEGRISMTEYIERYYEEHFNKLDPQKVFDEIRKDSIILCYERPEKFCHRQLVANWLMKNLNVQIVEL